MTVKKNDSMYNKLLTGAKEVEIDEKGEIIFEERSKEKFIFPGPIFSPEAERCKDKTDFREANCAVAMRCFFKDSNKSDWEWLDLACGRGNLIEHCCESFETDSIKIHYHGLDKGDRYKNDFELFVEEKNLDKHLAEINFMIADFTSWKKCFLETKGFSKYDWISFINVLHEIDPAEISAILLSMIKYCKKDGFLYFSDLEKLVEPEAGAITWTLEEMKEIFDLLFNKYLSYRFKRLVPTFSIIAQRSDLHKNINLNTEANEINKLLQKKIKSLLKRKRKNTEKNIKKLKKRLMFAEENRKSKNPELILTHYIELCKYYKIDQAFRNFKYYDLVISNDLNTCE